MRSVVLLPLACGLVVGQTYSEADKPRVYVSDSNSWQMVGGFSYSKGSGGGGFAGGASPQTVEVIKTFGQRCLGIIVTMDKTKADYVVLFDREGGNGVVHRRDKIAVFRNNGDVLYSGSTRSLGNAVQNSCQAIQGGTKPTMTGIAISHDAPPAIPETGRLEPVILTGGENVIQQFRPLIQVEIEKHDAGKARGYTRFTAPNSPNAFNSSREGARTTGGTIPRMV
jgi:hypothetical protein